MNVNLRSGWEFAVTCIRLSLLAVTVLATPALAQTILVDDFNDTNLDGWITVDSTVGQSYGPGTFDASDAALSLGTTGAVPPGIPGGGFLASLWEPSSDPVFTDGFLRTKVRANTTGTVASLALRTSGSLETGFNTYLFQGRTFPTPSFAWNKILGNEIVEVRDLDATINFRQGEDWNIEAGVVGDQLSMKVWYDDDPEPDSPQLVFTDSSFTSGTFGVETNNWVGDVRIEKPTIVSADFDDIYFTFARDPGDFDDDGDLDVDDLNTLFHQVNGAQNISYDVNGDRAVDNQDLNSWVKDLKNTWIGDANLDGEFNSGDLIAVFQAGEYEDNLPMNSTWGSGDWNWDTEFNSGDLVSAFQDGGYEQGSPDAVNAIPEPTSLLILIVGVPVIAHVRRTARNSPSRCSRPLEKSGT